MEGYLHCKSEQEKSAIWHWCQPSAKAHFGFYKILSVHHYNKMKASVDSKLYPEGGKTNEYFNHYGNHNLWESLIRMWECPHLLQFHARDLIHGQVMLSDVSRELLSLWFSQFISGEGAEECVCVEHFFHWNVWRCTCKKRSTLCLSEHLPALLNHTIIC